MGDIQLKTEGSNSLLAKKIAILGSGGNCYDIADTITYINTVFPKYNLTGFFDDSADAVHSNNKTGYPPVLGSLKDAEFRSELFLVNGIGSTRTYFKKDEIIKKTGVGDNRFETIIHPEAVISPIVKIGTGSVVLANVTICSGAVIGRHVLILPGAVINHDCKVGDYSIVASGAILNGNVQLEPLCYIGAGAVILENLCVGKQALIGAGSIVLKDVSAKTVVAGNPARVLKTIL